MIFLEEKLNNMLYLEVSANVESFIALPSVYYFIHSSAQNKGIR